MWVAAAIAGGMALALYAWWLLADSSVDGGELFARAERVRGGPDIGASLTEALDLYRKAAAAGHTQAYYRLGVTYMNGWGVTQDYAEGCRWLRKGAALGE